MNIEHESGSGSRLGPSSDSNGPLVSGDHLNPEVVRLRLRAVRQQRRLSTLTNILVIFVGLWLFDKIDAHFHSNANTQRPVLLLWGLFGLALWAFRRLLSRK